MSTEHWLWMLVAVLCGAFILGLLVLIARGGSQLVAAPYKRGPSLRYGASDDGSVEWLAEYFARLDVD